jgi:hypothetical protein
MMIRLFFLLIFFFNCNISSANLYCAELFSDIKQERVLKDKIQIVIEGAGDVVERFYFSAIESVVKQHKLKSKIEVIFTTLSNPNESAEIKQKREKIERRIQASNFMLLDKANPQQIEIYNNLKPDFVITASPPAIASQIVQHWLTQDTPPDRIFIDKPLGGSLADAAKLVEAFGPENKSAFAYSHYRAKPNLTMKAAREELDFLGGLRDLEFILTQDRSGSDLKADIANPNDRDGAIERELRAPEILNEGVGVDLLPHVFSILDYFAPLSSVKSEHHWIAKYKGVDGDPEKPAQIRGETFLAFDLQFKDRLGNEVNGHVAVGKGVRTRRFGHDYEHRASIMTLGGRNGNKIIYDFTFGIARYYNDRNEVVRTRELNRLPYETLFLNGLLSPESHVRDTFLYLGDGRDIRLLISNIVAAATNNNPIPLIPGGMGGSKPRPAPYIEDIIH